MEGKREYCGAFGIYSFTGENVAYSIYKGLINLQHRGQDSAGAATFDGKKIILRRGLGAVPDVLDENAISALNGHVGIGHVRYPTIGAGGPEDAQPFVINYPKRGLALAHNGNIANYGKVRAELEEGGRNLTSTCDSDLILNVFAEEYIKSKDVFASARGVMERLDGSFSVVMVTGEGELVAFRDQRAIRPLCFGMDKERIIFASESVALDINKCPLSGNVAPGEVFVVSGRGVERKIVMEKTSRRHCMFEYVYFSRPDAVLDGRLAYDVRMELGKRLAHTAPVKADVVVPVPDTSRPAAEGYARESGIQLAEGLIKNRYIGRTFIMPSQKKREDAVLLKLNAVRSILEGKKVLLIDDSIVRGTTSGPIVKLVRDAGAKEVHLRITCPPIVAPCFYGVDLPTYKELIAARMSVKEIEKFVGADSLAYLSIEDLIAAIGKDKKDLCLGCITGDYPTPFGNDLAKKIKKGGAKDGVRAWEEAE
jgi:amidophosphoribosyltransferase